MATHGYIQVAYPEDESYHVKLVHAMHDGYIDSMLKDLLAGFKLLKKYILTSKGTRFHVMRDGVGRYKHKGEINSLLLSLIPLDPEFNYVISALTLAAPFKYEVERTWNGDLLFTPDITVTVGVEVLPKLHFTIRDVEHVSKYTKIISQIQTWFPDRSVTIDVIADELMFTIDIYRAYMEWLVPYLNNGKNNTGLFDGIA